MKLLLFHLEITSYHIQMGAQGGTMDGVNANTFHMLIACVVLHARWVLNRLCFAVPANI